MKEKNETIYIEMANNKSNWLETLFKGAALIGGAWLTIELLKAFSRKVTVYSCPVCNVDITYNETPCHNCSSDLEWPK